MHTHRGEIQLPASSPGDSSPFTEVALFQAKESYPYSMKSMYVYICIYYNTHRGEIQLPASSSGDSSPFTEVALFKGKESYPYSAKSLSPGTIYSFYVLAESDHSAAASPTVFFTTDATAPDRCAQPEVVTRTKNSIKLR